MSPSSVTAPPPRHLDLSTLEGWLWEAACVIRGPVDAPKFKDYILPLIFLKRLSDVFDDELARLEREFGSRQIAEQLAREDRRLVRENAARIQGVLDTIDYNAAAAGQRILEDDRLALLVQVHCRRRSSPPLTARGTVACATADQATPPSADSGNPSPCRISRHPARYP